MITTHSTSLAVATSSCYQYMKYHLNIYTNWVRQCKTQVKARLLLGIKLRLLFFKAVNIIN